MEVANTCCSIPALYSQKPTLSHPVRVSIMRSVGGDGFVWYCHLLPLTESTKVRGRGGVSYRNTHQKTQTPRDRAESEPQRSPSSSAATPNYLEWSGKRGHQPPRALGTHPTSDTNAPRL